MREWLKKRREHENLSQEQIAELCNITQQAYSAIEKGDRRPSVETAKKIAEFLGFDWKKFYE